MNDQEQPLYISIASALVALRSSIAKGNTQWQSRWRERLDVYAAQLPSGSGFDTGTRISLEESTPDKLVLITSFHHMNEHGMYTRWTDHKIVVRPSLAFQIDVKVGGLNHRDIKEYIGEVFQTCLMEPMPPATAPIHVH